jgi:hypothetical protein
MSEAVHRLQAVLEGVGRGRGKLVEVEADDIVAACESIHGTDDDQRFAAVRQGSRGALGLDVVVQADDLYWLLDQVPTVMPSI